MITYPNTKEKMKLWDAAPMRCPFTQLKKYFKLVNENIVYRTEIGRDCYTIPTYDSKEKAFFRYHYDIGCQYEYGDIVETHEKLCTLEEIEDRMDIEEIKKIYGIKEGKKDE